MANDLREHEKALLRLVDAQLEELEKEVHRVCSAPKDPQDPFGEKYVS